MGGFTGVWQWVVVLVIVLILFGGRGKISRVMGDIGKGIKSFKTGVSSDEKEPEAGEEEEEEPKVLKSEAAEKEAAKAETKKVKAAKS